jgi:GNAT superfamily N-acetyltransferase
VTGTGFRSDQPVLRAADVADAAAIADVQTAAWQAGYRDIIPADHLAMTNAGGPARWVGILMRESVPDPPGRSRTYVAEDGGGAIVGISTVGSMREQSDPDLGELWMLNVAPGAWGTGVAVRLHDHVLDRLRENGYGEAILWVLTRNARARRFYERSGWRADGGVKVEDILGFPVEETRYRIAL